MICAFGTKVPEILTIPTYVICFSGRYDARLLQLKKNQKQFFILLLSKMDNEVIVFTRAKRSFSSNQ